MECLWKSIQYDSKFQSDSFEGQKFILTMIYYRQYDRTFRLEIRPCTVWPFHNWQQKETSFHCKLKADIGGFKSNDIVRYQCLTITIHLIRQPWVNWPPCCCFIDYNRTRTNQSMYCWQIWIKEMKINWYGKHDSVCGQ